MSHAWAHSKPKSNGTGPYRYNAVLQNYRAPQKGYSGGYPANTTYKWYDDLYEALKDCNNNEQCKAVTARRHTGWQGGKWKLGSNPRPNIPVGPPQPHAVSKMLTQRSTDYNIPIDKQAICACDRSAVWKLDKIRGHPECIDYKCMRPEAYKFGNDRPSCNINIVDCSQQVNLNDVERAQLQDIKLAADCKMEVAPDPAPAAPDPSPNSEHPYQIPLDPQWCGHEGAIHQDVPGCGRVCSDSGGNRGVKSQNNWPNAPCSACPAAKWASCDNSAEAEPEVETGAKIADTIKEKVGGNVAVIGAAIGAVVLIIFVLIVIIAIRKRRSAKQ